MVQEAAHELAGRGVVVQVNSDENHRLAGRFGIRSVPTVLCLKGGKVVASAGGAMDKNALLVWWQRHAA